MAKYYRVNLKNKMGNIIYPNIHNLISIDKTTGGMTFAQGSILLSQGGITLSNGKIISKGLSLRGGHLYLEGTYGAVLDNTTKIVFGTPESNYANITANNGGAIAFYQSLTDKTNGFFWNPGQKAISPENDNQLSCGMSDKRWTNVYSINGNFSGPINSSVMTNSHIAGNRGENVIINSTRTEANAYVMLARFKSSNGVFTIGRWRDAFHLFYTAQSVVDAGTNAYTKNLVLLNESGNSTFPGIIKASNQIQASTAGTYRIAMGGGDSYAWIDCRDNTDTMVTNMTLTPNGINLYKDTYISGALSLNGNLSFTDSGTAWKGIKGTSGGNDQWYIGGKADAGDAGYLLIATGDGGNEPIYVRQYSNGGPPSGTITRTLTLLNASGNSSFPGLLTATSVNNYRYTRFNGANNGARWINLGTLVINGADQICNVTVYSGNGYNAGTNQNTQFDIFIKKGYQATASATSAFGVTVISSHNVSNSIKVKLMCSSSTTGVLWVYLPWAYWNGYYEIRGAYNSWTHNGGNSSSEPTSGTVQPVTYFHEVYSKDASVRNLYANTKATWDSNYSNYPSGTVMFCW